MHWGLSILIAIVTAVAGTFGAGFVADRSVTWHRISSFEGGSAYFVVAFGLLGMFSGLIIGLITSRVVAAPWSALGTSFGIVLALCGIAAFLSRLAGEVPAEYKGDRLNLLVELRMPQGWKPDNAVKYGTNYCGIQALRSGGASKATGGRVVSDKIAEGPDGRWIVPCYVYLFTSRPNKLMDMHIGATRVSFVVKIPSSVYKSHFEWTSWLNKEFGREVGKPPVEGFEFRYRIQRVADTRAAEDAETAAHLAARAKALAALNPEESPITEFAALTTDDSDTVSNEARDIVEKRALELKPLLLSKDPKSVKLALSAASRLVTVPDGLGDAFVASGWTVEQAIRAAKGSAPDTDPDLEKEDEIDRLFSRWNQMAPKDAPWKDQRREILKAIEAAAKDARPESKVFWISATAKYELESLDRQEQ
jgi:hypothetical protein